MLSGRAARCFLNACASAVRRRTPIANDRFVLKRTRDCAASFSLFRSAQAFLYAAIRFAHRRSFWIASKVSFLLLVQSRLVLFVVYLPARSYLYSIAFPARGRDCVCPVWIPSPPATHTLSSFDSPLVGSHDQWLGLDEQYQRTDYPSARADATLKVTESSWGSVCESWQFRATNWYSSKSRL
jgi:hypothetical protein